MCSAMIRLTSRTVDMSSCWSFIATSLPAARPSSFAPLKRRGAPGWIRDFAEGRLQSLCGVAHRVKLEKSLVVLDGPLFAAVLCHLGSVQLRDILTAGGIVSSLDG